MPQAGNSAHSLPLPPLDTQLPKWYHSIHELPLNKFAECSYNQNLHALTIQGNPSADDLQAAWVSIMAEYSEAIGDNEFTLKLRLFQETETLRINYEALMHLIETIEGVTGAGEAVLWSEPCRDIVGSINKALRTSFRFPPDDAEQFSADIKRCRARSAGLKIGLELKMQAYDAIQSKEAVEGGPIKRGYFESILISLSDHAGFEVRDSITVYVFCERIKKLNAHNEAMDKLNKRK